MDKNTIIAKIASDPDDRLLLARIMDKYEQMERRGIPTATCFLTPREQAMATALLGTIGVRSGFLFDGGYESAERKILLFLPEWAEGDDDALSFLRADFHGADSTLSHRDLLGSLMGLGITREKLGDILIAPHSADLIVSPALSEFLLREWTGAGRVKLSISPIVREDLLIPEVKTRTIRDTVSSPRLDAIVSSAFAMSRGRASELIAAGKVSLDHVPCEKPDKPVAEGAVITARGFGKAKLTQLGGLTKKGRTGITIEKYE